MVQEYAVLLCCSVAVLPENDYIAQRSEYCFKIKLRAALNHLIRFILSLIYGLMISSEFNNKSG